ncbi:MAG TPA: LLM class F420-dependent oxidoreductase [Acidimicrobiales bacterium]|nr:LLM class F420-dependent oxidoreductase [Acidimicrobiales bacterium]
MKIDAGIGPDLTKAVESARQAEATGYDGIWSAETNSDPFLPLLLAAEHTERIEIGTGIAVAFARSPMTTAAQAHALQNYSQGRFLLGLGSQIKPHIEKRFSMPWSHPAPRMREFILALRAIWDCWNNGTKLDFRGEFYSHTLMTPFFTPPASPNGPPQVFLAAVGEKMTEVVGEVADGMLVHGFTTKRYLREVTMGALERGAAKADKTAADIQLSLPCFIVTGADDESTAAADQAVRQQIAFYGSTPAYRGVLELHGWGDLQTELNVLSKQGQWKEMGEAVTDDVLHAFAVVAEPDDVADGLHKRFGDIVHRLSFYTPYAVDDEITAHVVERLKNR